jgi:hypothetical protein
MSSNEIQIADTQFDAQRRLGLPDPRPPFEWWLG